MDYVRDERLLERVHKSMGELHEIGQWVYEAYTGLMASASSDLEMEQLRKERTARVRIFQTEITEWGDMVIREVLDLTGQRYPEVADEDG